MGLGQTTTSLPSCAIVYFSEVKRVKYDALLVDYPKFQGVLPLVMMVDDFLGYVP